MSDSFSPAPNPDAFAEPGSPSALLLTALQSATPSREVTADLIFEVSDIALFHLLPLCMSTLQFIGECTSDRDSFIALLSALRMRVGGNRVLKQRFLLHASHPSFNAYWRVDEKQQNEAEEEEEGNREISVEEYEEDDPEGETSPDDDNDEEEDEEQVEERDRKLNTARKSIKQVVFPMMVSETDMKSLEFWRSGVYENADQVEKGYSYDIDSNIINPLYRDFAADECVGDEVLVKKVFSSIARPKIVGVGDTTPGILVKKGDNLKQDLGVMHVQQTLNLLWSEDETLKSEFGPSLTPVATWYDVVPTDVDTGIMQAVSGLESLKEFDWDAWMAEVEGNEERIHNMVRTVCGAYIATYIIGGRDRHFDNILILNANAVLHIDFTYIFGKGPPLDAPPISLASEMQTAFETLGVWELFIELCGGAYDSARRNCSTLLRVARHAFARTGIATESVTKFLRGKYSLALGKEDGEAKEAVEQQVRGGAKSMQTWIKRVAHDVVDPAWYGLLKKGFPPAVKVMQWLDESENEEAKKMAEDLKALGDAVNDEERVKIEDE